jgi:hypothetical protein
MPGRREFLRIGLHRSAVEHQLLLMHGSRPADIVTEKQWIFEQPNLPARGERGMRCEKLVRMDECDFGH